MKKEIQEILDNIQYDDFYQKTFESSKNYKTLVDELNYNERCHNLEEQLGCKLEVVFKALMNGIYTKESIFDNELDLFEVRGIEKKGVSVISQFCGYADCDFTCEYKDYKKTWWLRKDKSE